MAEEEEVVMAAGHALAWVEVQICQAFSWLGRCAHRGAFSGYRFCFYRQSCPGCVARLSLPPSLDPPPGIPASRPTAAAVASFAPSRSARGEHLLLGIVFALVLAFHLWEVAVCCCEVEVDGRDLLCGEDGTSLPKYVCMPA